MTTAAPTIRYFSPGNLRTVGGALNIKSENGNVELLFRREEVSAIQAPVRDVSAVRQIACKVNALHVEGAFAESAATLLTSIREFMVGHDYDSLDTLMNELSTQHYEDDRSLSRLHNIIALTMPAKNNLRTRSTLLKIYETLLRKRFGNGVARRISSPLA